MLFEHENERRLKIAVVGCGSHAERSIFPCFPYLAVDVVAVCDPQRARAEKAARQFGVSVICDSLAEVIQMGDAEAVLLAVGPRQHPELACQALDSGLHVWLEKPPALAVRGVDRMIQSRDASGKFVVVGLKKVFMPATGRMQSSLADSKFGALRTLTARYPTEVPPNGADVLHQERFTDWLGNGIHPLSLMVYLGGRPDFVTTHRAPNGGGFVVLEYPSGAVGSLHLALGHGRSGPMERYEIVCEHGHMVLDNNTRLSIYRPGYPFDYTRGHDYAAGGEDVAALIYEPQHSLSTLDNKAIFLQGFVQELEHFVYACLHDAPPTRGTLELARAVMECYEASLLSEGQPVRLDDLPVNQQWDN